MENEENVVIEPTESAVETEPTEEVKEEGMVPEEVAEVAEDSVV